MFSGIIEAVEPVLSSQFEGDVVRVKIRRPKEFNDLKEGDSIAVNGVCLTVESWTQDFMQFAIGVETRNVLKMTDARSSAFKSDRWNLERSLKFGDRLHGHLVSGHAEGIAHLNRREVQGECLLLWFAMPASISQQVWVKGSITLNGVSLTVNSLEQNANQILLGVCLIPETLKKTNLGDLEVGAQITFETDWMAKLHRQHSNPTMVSLAGSIFRVNLEHGVNE